ncbi:MAG: transposase [Patescibacteria group bacterium]
MFIPTEKHPAFFITLDVRLMTKIFVRDDLCQIIIDSWNYCEKHYNIKVMNYVIMPDHIHFIFYFKNENEKLIKKEKIGLRGKYNIITNGKIDDFIKNFKKFTAHEILKRLKQEESEYLSRFALKKEKKNKHYFTLWLDDKHNVIINNEEVLKKKQKYIFNNPIKKGLVNNINEYKYIK